MTFIFGIKNSVFSILLKHSQKKTDDGKSFHIKAININCFSPIALSILAIALININSLSSTFSEHCLSVFVKLKRMNIIRAEPAKYRRSKDHEASSRQWPRLVSKYIEPFRKDGNKITNYKSTDDLLPTVYFLLHSATEEKVARKIRRRRKGNAKILQNFHTTSVTGQINHQCRTRASLTTISGKT